MRLFARINRKRLIVGLLLAVYGSAGVLGHGLHAVWDCHHHCHEHATTSGVILEHSHCHAHNAHQHEHEHEHEHGHHENVHYKHEGHGQDSHGPMVAEQGTAPCDLQLAAINSCPICEFLVQAQSPDAWEPVVEETGLVSTTLFLGDITCVVAFVATHSARGPPLS